MTDPAPRPRRPRRPAARAAASGAPLRAGLELVAARVVERWPRAELSRITSGDLTVAARILLNAVEAASQGRSAPIDGIPPFVQARRLLERIRREWLQDPLSREADATLVLETVRAIDVVVQRLDDDAVHRFVSRLGSLDAQQLVVEMAHDMRSPLGSILILAERLRAGGGGALPPIQQRQLGLIYSAAFGLSSLAGDVIELARGGTALLDPAPVAFSVKALLGSIGDILRPMAEEKNLTLVCEGPVADVRLGHPAALNRVLLNLATNAIKFTNVGEVRLVVLEHDRTNICFEVRDTGRGIPDSVMANLFEAFRQRQTPGDYAFSSAGLGLSICQKLVRAMGGELVVTTALERGTTFAFTLALPQPAAMG